MIGKCDGKFCGRAVKLLSWVVVRVIAFIGEFVQARSEITHADYGDGRDDKSDDGSTHFSPPSVRLANKCRPMQARIQPIPPITMVRIGGFSHNLLIL